MTQQPPKEKSLVVNILERFENGEWPNNAERAKAIRALKPKGGETNG